jgi:hypothetical protein
MSHDPALPKLVRMYRSTGGIWRYDIERDGKFYWSSLHTRDEQKARAKYEQMKARMKKAREEK